MLSRSRSLFAGLLLALWALAAIAQQPKNIIVLYADGVAATQWEFGRYSSRALRNAGFAVTDVVFQKGSLGLLTTHAHEAFATDSAAAGSAMSTGVKTTVGAIGVGPDGKPVRAAVEVASADDKPSGIVVRVVVADALSAEVLVHVADRF